jgi:hypothetical protein
MKKLLLFVLTTSLITPLYAFAGSNPPKTQMEVYNEHRC